MFNIWLDLSHVIGNLFVTINHKRVDTSSELPARNLKAFTKPNFSIWLLDFTSLLCDDYNNKYIKKLSAQ